MTVNAMSNVSSGVCALTARIRARSGAEQKVAAALKKVAAAVALTEPRTLAYYVNRATDDDALFVTVERFADREAMDEHNGSAAVAAFVTEIDGCLEGAVEITMLNELSALSRT